MEGPPRALSSQAMGLSHTGAGCDFNIVTCWHVPVLKSSACEDVARVASSVSQPSMAVQVCARCVPELRPR